MNILIIEDDAAIRQELKLLLENALYQVTVLTEFHHVVEDILQMEPDLILLDVNLPQQSGFEICKSVRKTSDVPIIFLTSRTDSMDELSGMLQGGDDYITKPFKILELKARIKAILRRSVKKAPAETQEKKVLKARDLELSFDSRRVFISGKEVNLTAKEFDLLELLMENPGKVYSREKLLDTVWGYDYPGDVRTVDVHVRRLREKIEVNPSEPKYIFTKWGVGYYFN